MPMTEKTDRRVQRTLGLLKDAYCQLYTEKDYSQITISEICERAQIRRTTFYKHFQDKEALARWFTQEKQREFSAYSAEAEKESSANAWLIALMRNMLRFLDDNEKLVNAVLRSGERGQKIMEDFLRACLQDVNMHSLYTGDDPNAAAFRTELCMGGILAVFRWWFSSPKPCSEEAFLQLLLDFSERVDFR